MNDQEILCQFHKLPDKTQNLLYEFLGCAESMTTDEQSRAENFISTAKAEGTSTDSALEMLITALNNKEEEQTMNTEEKTTHEAQDDFNPHAKIKCCLCGREIEQWQGNNPWPLVDDAESMCCHDCNTHQVIPARIHNHAKQN